MTNLDLKMSDLLDRCEGCEHITSLLQRAIERLYVDDTDPPAELAAALGALDVAVAAMAALDEASR
jgi:hypothetical protein